MLFALIPMHFMDGFKLRTWSRAAWWALWPPVAFAFGYLTLLTTDDPPALTEVGPMPALFLSFAAISVATWAYARWRLRHLLPQSQ
ncbi:hypothetical protein HNP84_001642 [Thermocatellispora tengchongensis]|uniref:Uncharacterized protein n=1 Tax=Thermocatellispora tengchongensis TaxID=1073253 RepID=A0A840NYT4_9ACTN|nr:hypothetical protein [Thermocatellispora tengchongensis]MBB5131929.1 hypothetical protein [Thermocatellispora tengchongensis]